MAKMPVDLFRDHIFFKLIVGPVILVGLDHAVDRTVDVFGKNALDFHEISPPT